MNHVGCNITENKLQIVEVVKNSKGYFLENVDEEGFSEELDFKSCDTNFSTTIQNAIENLWIRHPLKSTRISLVLPIDKFRIFNFPLEKSLSDDRLKEQIEWEFSILFPTLSIEDYIIRPKIVFKSFYSHQEILVVAADKKIIEPLHNVLSENNLTLQFVDCSHFASDLFVNKQNSVSIFVSNNSLSCSVYSNGGMIGFRKFNSSDKDTLVDYLGNIMSHHESDLNKFYIASDSDIDETKAELERSLKNNFEYLAPFQRIQPSETFVKNDFYSLKSSIFSAAAGIGFRLS